MKRPATPARASGTAEPPHQTEPRRGRDPRRRRGSTGPTAAENLAPGSAEPIGDRFDRLPRPRPARRERLRRSDQGARRPLPGGGRLGLRSVVAAGVRRPARSEWRQREALHEHELRRQLRNERVPSALIGTEGAARGVARDEDAATAAGASLVDEPRSCPAQRSASGGSMPKRSHNAVTSCTSFSVHR